jgi:hypothetical protein
MFILVIQWDQTGTTKILRDLSVLGDFVQFPAAPLYLGEYVNSAWKSLHTPCGARVLLCQGGFETHRSWALNNILSPSVTHFQLPFAQLLFK